MRKQVDYEFRLFRVSAVDPSASRQMLQEEIRAYLANGWEVLSADVTKVDVNDVYVSFSLVKYEDATAGAKVAAM